MISLNSHYFLLEKTAILVLVAFFNQLIFGVYLFFDSYQCVSLCHIIVSISIRDQQGVGVSLQEEGATHPFASVSSSRK